VGRRNFSQISPFLHFSALARCLSDKVGREKDICWPLWMHACSPFQMNNGLIAGARSTIAATRKGHLPKPLGLVHFERLTPIPAHVFRLVTVIVLLFSGGIYDLLYYTGKKGIEIVRHTVNMLL